MIESPRWLANKGHYARCAVELGKIAKINGKKVEYTEKSLRDLMPDNDVETVYGMASLFTGWRLAKNTVLIVICW
jgi:MFS transporter, OCT family, solute carrier family 22 (organic cation transporter), member 4/5